MKYNGWMKYYNNWKNQMLRY